LPSTPTRTRALRSSLPKGQDSGVLGARLQHRVLQPTAGRPILRRPMDSAFPVLLFYKYVSIENPERFAAEQRGLCSLLGLKGRIIIAQEGLNGTLAGEKDCVAQYMDALRADSRFSDIEFKLSDGTPDTFPRLSVKVRPEIVTLGAPMPLTADLDNHLSPTEWKHRLEEDPDTVVIDVRNTYESVAGRFAGAVTCEIENFRELPAYLEKLAAYKDKTVLMYCTGGIRCEKASALFRADGFQNVFQLHGGIVNYQKEYGNAHWEGECFVFDKRMTVRVDKDLTQVGRCAHSERPTSRFVYCLHDLCHRLFLLAPETEAENAETVLCPDCLASGLTRETADYKGSPARLPKP